MASRLAAEGSARARTKSALRPPSNRAYHTGSPAPVASRTASQVGARASIQAAGGGVAGAGAVDDQGAPAGLRGRPAEEGGFKIGVGHEAKHYTTMGGRGLRTERDEYL
jgi:hypothetical protein